MKTSSATTLVLFLAWAAPAPAKPPTLDGIFPAGGRRGTTVVATASGTFGRWPVRAWTDGDGDGVAIEVLPEKGKLSIAVADDAPPGVRWIRLFDDEGATTPRPFLVGTLPEAVEAEPNDDPTRPQTLDALAPGVTVNGKLGRKGDVDGFSMALRKGQTLVAALEASRRLGSPMDGLLQVVSADGFVLDENDDAPGHDPLLVFEAPADGTYLVRSFAFPSEPDSRIGYSGAESYVYRLTLTTGGYLDHVYPLSVPRGSSGQVEAAGWNIPEEARRIEVVPREDPGTSDRATVGHPLLAGAGEVRVESGPTAVEAEPNPPEHPQDVTFPATISGRIDPPRDRDAFRFAARRGEKWHLRVESRSLEHPLDAVLQLLDASGKVVSEVDDTGRRRKATRDPELTFSPAEDGAFRVVVRDLNGQGSFRHAYRLTAAPPVPDYDLTLAADRFTVEPGKPLKIPVTVARDDGFGGTVEVEAVGIPEDIPTPRASSAPTGPTAKSVTLELNVPPGRDAWSGPFRVVGRVREADELTRTAGATLPGLNASTEAPWLTIPEPKPPTPPAEPVNKESGEAKK